MQSLCTHMTACLLLPIRGLHAICTCSPFRSRKKKQKPNWAGLNEAVPVKEFKEWKTWFGEEVKLKEKTCKAGEANVVVGMAKVVSAEHMMSGGNPAAAKTVASTVTKDNRHDPKCLARVEETVDCSICWEILRPKNNVRGLPCGHVYHRKCLDDWYKRTWERTMHLCPACREAYFVDVDDG